MADSDLKERLREERAQLRDRIRKLSAFEETSRFDALPADERMALRDQLEAMHRYQTILVNRAKRLGIEP